MGRNFRGLPLQTAKAFVSTMATENGSAHSALKQTMPLTRAGEVASVSSSVHF